MMGWWGDVASSTSPTYSFTTSPTPSPTYSPTTSPTYSPTYSPTASPTYLTHLPTYLPTYLAISVMSDALVCVPPSSFARWSALAWQLGAPDWLILARYSSLTSGRSRRAWFKVGI